MNKRQKKKQYKRKYGYNPPKIKQQDTTLAEAIRTSGEKFKAAAEAAGEALNKYGELIRKTIKEVAMLYTQVARECQIKEDAITNTAKKLTKRRKNEKKRIDRWRKI